MEYLIIQADTFERAMKYIHAQYGKDIIVISRKNTIKKSFFSRKEKTRVEVVFTLGKRDKEIKNTRSKKENWHNFENLELQKVSGTTHGEVRSESNTNETFPDNDELLLKIDNHINEEDNNKISFDSNKEVDFESIRNRITSFLYSNDFQQCFNEFFIQNLINCIAEISKSLEKNYTFSEKELDLLILEKLNEIFPVSKQQSNVVDNNHDCICLIGPTGAGKTTTVAKLAASYLHEAKKNTLSNNSVSMITIDTYRIGAKSQIKTFGDIMGIEVVCIDSSKGINDYFNANRDKKLIIIDTMGRSPKDAEIIQEMRNILLESNEKIDYYLTIPASMKYEDVLITIRRYKEFKITGIIITKIDETTSIGHLLSAVYESKIPIAYYTDGQKVPSDLHRASAYTMAKYYNQLSIELSDFPINLFN